MTMKLLRILPIAAGALVLAGCSASASFEAELTAAVAESKGSLVLSSLPAVDGSSFLVVCPYDSAASIAERLGFAWADAPDVSQDDGRQTVVIIEGDEVTSHVELSRGEIDFCAGEEWAALPTDTRLTVTRTEDAAVITAP